MNVFVHPEIADAYDDYYKTDAWKKVNEIEENLIEQALQQVPVGEMLELGCGTGHWTGFFLKKGFELTATDISEAMLKHAFKKNMGAEIVNADAENLPFGNESFGVVSSVTMMEFVSDKTKVIDEVFRVLKPKGWLLLGALNRDSEMGKSAASDSTFKNADFFTPESLAGLLAKIGTPVIKSGVHLTPDFRLADGTKEQANYEPAFMVALVQKNV